MWGRVFVRNQDIEGIPNWAWLKDDENAWLLITRDWASHRNVIGSIPNRRVCIQAGGHQGLYPRLLSLYFGSVYTFEPDPFNFFVLSQNCGSSQILKYQAFLGTDPGFFKITRASSNFPIFNSGMSCLVAGNDSGGNIPILRIDDFGFPIVDLLWLDVESTEILALRGAYETIKRCRPVIMAENGDEPSVVKFMKSLDYRATTKSGLDTVYVP